MKLADAMEQVIDDAKRIIDSSMVQAVEPLARFDAAARACAPKTVCGLILELAALGLEVSFTPYEEAPTLLVRVEERSPSGRFVECFVDLGELKGLGDIVLAGALLELQRQIKAT